jgi:chitinase
LHGSWDTNLGHHTGLYPLKSEKDWRATFNVDWAIDYWIKKGAQKEKILMGMATYGRSFKLSSPGLTELGSPARGPGTQGNVSDTFNSS